LIDAPEVKHASLATIANILPSESNKRYSMTVLDESGSQSNVKRIFLEFSSFFQSLRFSPEDKEREKLVKEHYEAKVSQIQSQLNVADLKVTLTSIFPCVTINRLLNIFRLTTILCKNSKSLQKLAINFSKNCPKRFLMWLQPR
jgi:hypothetical protein